MSNRVTTTGLALSFFLMTAALAGCASNGSSVGPVGTGPFLDQSENRLLTDATQQAAESSKTGERVQWEHKDDKTGLVTSVGFVEPKSDTYVASNGEFCRDLKQAIVKSGERYVQTVLACRRTAYNNQPATDAWVIRQS